MLLLQRFVSRADLHCVPPQSPANVEAAKLYSTNRVEYNRRVRRVSARSVDD